MRSYPVAGRSGASKSRPAPPLLQRTVGSRPPCGADFQQAALLYDRKNVLPMRDERSLAVPLRELWER